MSDCENNIRAFIKLLEQYPSLLSPQDRTDLSELANTLSASDADISAVLQTWVASRSQPQINQTYQTLQKISKADLSIGPGRTESPTQPNQPSQASKELLINTIKKNSSFPDPSPAQS